MKKFLEEFKKFALRGNVIDLAVGVIIGGAFTGIVTAVTDNFINPLLNFILTRDPGAGWSFGGSVSSFLTTLINFFITALVLFLILRAMNTLASLGKKKEPEAPTTKKCPFCLSEIPIDATRCPHCTSQLGSALDKQ